MKLRFSLFLLAFTLATSAAMATDFGIHGGYYGGDLKAGFVGADLRLPFGPVAIMPNIDYSRSHGINWWFASGDVDLQYSTSGGGPSYWFGAGPHNGEWGYDVNAGLGWGAAGFRPYVTGRYMKIKDFKTTGAAIGLRF